MRRSVRLGAAAAARVPAAPGALPPADTAAEDTDEEDAAADVSSWRLLRLHRPEWPLVLGGSLAAFLVGATMPAFAFLFSKLYGVSGCDCGAGEPVSVTIFIVMNHDIISFFK